MLHRIDLHFLLILAVAAHALPSPSSDSEEEDDSGFNMDVQINNGGSIGSIASFFSRMANVFHGLISKFDVSGSVELRSLEQIYQAALREGNGSLVVYQGGTATGQGDGTKQAFEQRFPGLTVDIVVDYSTNHGPRIDVQLDNGSLVPDVAQLQTLQDYPKWKREGQLLKYKPANWSKVYEGFRDPDGYFTAHSVLLISTVVNSQQVANESQYPRTAEDFLRPEFGGGRLVVVHPNMDDFVLFYFKQVVDKYGMDYLTQFAAQQPMLVCDGMPQLGAVGMFPSNLTASVGVAAFASFDFGNGSVPRLAFPEDDDPFATYATYGAIFADAKRPETAKLYINWQLEKESPSNQGNIWPVRTDMQPQQGFRQVWEYPNSDHAAFLAFMEDYEERARFGKQIDLFLGPVPGNCDTRPLQPGIYPQ